MSDDKVGRGASSTGSLTSSPPSSDAQHEQLERALAELLALDRSHPAEPSRYRRLAAVTGIISVALVLVVIGSLLALSHLSPKVVHNGSSPSTTAAGTPSTTGAPGGTTIPPPGNAASGTAISAITAASRNTALTSTVGQGGQPILLMRTPASSFITSPPPATPIVEYLWTARCGACGLENLVVASALIELGGTFRGMSPLSFGNSYSSVDFGTYRGPVLFEPVETVAPPGMRDGIPTPQAEGQYQLYDRFPFTTSASALPFLDIASHYVAIGSDIPAGLVKGRTLRQLAVALRSPDSTIARAIVGSANILTAGICTTLSALARPLPSVCSSGVIQQLEASLPTAPPGH